MWRRRRDKARAPERLRARLTGRGSRVWRMDQPEAARVALTPPAEFVRQAAQDMVPAPSAWPANGRLGTDMASVYCIRCGGGNPEGARFCSQCGTPLPRSSAEGAAETTSIISVVGAEPGDTEFVDEAVSDAAGLDNLPVGTALLVVQRGPNAGSRFLLDSDLTLVGRHPDSDIFLDDVTVSRRHAEFYRSGSRFTVRDVGSLNGTYVNRERIEERDLTGGDEVQVGKFRLVFLLGPRSQAEYGGGGAQVGG